MIPVFITARLGSERLPAKHLMRLGDTTVINHVVLRARHFGFDPILCVPEEDFEALDDAVGCETFAGDSDNVEARLIECAHKYDHTIFHHIDGDDPFFSRELVIESIQCFLRGPFSRIMPCNASQSGSGLVGTSYNLKPPSNSRIEDLPDPVGTVWPQRLTLDYMEDYHLICAVNRMVGGYMAPRWAVDEVFRRNPDLHKINWFRTQEWKERQLDEMDEDNWQKWIDENTEKEFERLKKEHESGN